MLRPHPGGAPWGLPNYASEVAKLTTHFAVDLDGVIVKNPKGGNEIQADPAKGDALRVIGWVEDPYYYPIRSLKPHSFEYLREVAHLRPRTNTFGAVSRVRHWLAIAIHRFFHERRFFSIHTPIIASDCEVRGRCSGEHAGRQAGGSRSDGAGIGLTKDFFGKEAHLTVSGQLNVETMCLASRYTRLGRRFERRTPTRPGAWPNSG